MPRSVLPLVVLLLGVLLAPHQLANAAPTAAVPLPSSISRNPLIAALTALGDPSALSAPRSGDSTGAATPRSSSRAMGVPQASASANTAAAAPAAAAAPLDALRPAAAAALARSPSGAAPLTDDDITAINILLSREEPPSRPYAYDTGMPTMPHLVTFGGSNNSTTNSSSMQSSERLSKLRSLGQPLSWLGRSYAVSGDTLLKLRITQQLQLILQDAISDSLASSADLPPNQVVTFAASNLSFSLGFNGVDWDDGVIPLTSGATAAAAAAATAQQLPHKGLEAVKKALQELTGNFDAGHTLVSLEPPAAQRSAAAAAGGGSGGGQGVKQRVGQAATVAGSGRVPPAAASSARKLLLKPKQAQLQDMAATSSSHMQQRQQQHRRQLAQSAAANPSTQQLQVVYVQLVAMDPMNLTSLMDRLSNCTAGGQQQQYPALQEAGRASAVTQLPPTTAGGAAGTARHSVGQLPAGQPLTPFCTDVFRRHFVAQAVPVESGPGFSVAPYEKPRATTSLSVAVGVTREQEQTDGGADSKAGAWLNSTAMSDILATFNLTTTSTDSDYVSYIRDRQSGEFPVLPGLNLTSLLPSLVQTVLAAGKNLSQLEAQQRQQQQLQQQQRAVAAPSSVTLNKGILAGIITAVVASVLALLGVVVLLLRRRSDNSNSGSSQQDSGQSAPERRRRRRPRMYHTKYLSTDTPVLGHADAQQQVPTTDDGLRHKLERGDSVMSQVNIEMDDAQDEEEDQGSEGEAGSSRTLTTGVPRQQPSQWQPQQQQQWRQLERQEGEAGSSGSNSALLLKEVAHPSCSAASTSSAAAAANIAPADSAACSWDDSSSSLVGGARTTSSIALTANSSSLSPWGSNSNEAQQQQGSGAVGAASASLKPGGSRTGGRHRLATASQAQQQQAAAAAAAAAATQEAATHMSTAAAAAEEEPSGGGVAGSGSFNVASAFAAMDAQLDAAVRAGAASSGGGAGGGVRGGVRGGSSSSGGGSAASSAQVQPLGNSCWHKQGHVSGFLLPDAAATAAAVAADGCSSAGAAQSHQQQAAQGQRRSTAGGWVSPFAAAIQLAHSVASDEM